MSEAVDVVIIGAGVIGAATAYELGKRGYRTLNIDKLAAAGSGPTSNSCAIVRAHYSTRQGVGMAYSGFSYWEDWKTYLGDIGDQPVARYVQCGTLLLENSSGHHRKVLSHYKDLGVEFEEWDTDAIHARLPLLDLHAFWPPKRPADEEFWNEPADQLPGGIFTPRSGYVNDPALATQNLQQAAERLGGQFRFRRTVVAVRRDGGRVAGVTLSDGAAIDAPIVVNVAGPHSFLINRLADVEQGMKRRTRALRHEVHHVPAPPDFDFEHDGLHISDGDLGIYYRPDVGNHILIGSEDPACDPQVWVDDPNDFDRNITADQWEAQVYRLARRIPSLPIPNQRRGVVDLYDCSDDWIPIYDRSDLDGFYMAIGTSGNQFKNGPVAGHCMAELIDAIEGGLDHDREPLKVTLPYTEIEVDLGYYSRLREPDPDSSFSVNG